jgi:hypothetical protein
MMIAEQSMVLFHPLLLCDTENNAQRTDPFILLAWRNSHECSLGQAIGKGLV